jgi:hypothetical protein
MVSMGYGSSTKCIRPMTPAARFSLLVWRVMPGYNKNMSKINSFLKITLVAIGVIVILIVFGEMFLVNHEISEIILDNSIIKVETTRIFGEKLAEARTNKSGFYHGAFVSWHLLSNKIRQNGQFENGFWHGKWFEYYKDGRLQCTREWDKGKLINYYIPDKDKLIQISKQNWPKYANVKQTNPEKI